ncbi:uncharacterized protein LOC5505290 isoform X2 [Nematostella vectensis]|uniref:uncharacterized protein LOC5505290 isoform X2 n=1 Tax=Nematostella vectensis TaxID=45351 RepID=UPI0020773E6F|nr:uncharacterized protein LOC5505290 isoform X2 [Nematostella vectensis]
MASAHAESEDEPNNQMPEAIQDERCRPLEDTKDGLTEDSGFSESRERVSRVVVAQNDDDDNDEDSKDIDEWLDQHGHHADLLDSSPVVGSESESYGLPQIDSLSKQNKDEASLNIGLLEEICEEAANMTIKEALIFSLKPNVRAGISLGNFELSETEILELELYCESFIGGLIKDVLKKNTLLEGGKSTDDVDIVGEMKKQLTGVSLLELKLNCDLFVRNIIAESIIDSSIITAKARQDTEKEIKDPSSLGVVLDSIHNSEELQGYFSKVTSEIVKRALEKIAHIIEEDTVEPRLFSISTSMNYEQDDTANKGKCVELDEGVNYEQDDTANKGKYVELDEGERGCSLEVPESEGGTITPSCSDAGDMSMEFDMDWVKGVLHNIKTKDEGPKDKFVMKELEFDENVNVGGTELLAPVFLAIAEENDDDTEFQGMRRKAQSIEDLLGKIEERDPLQRRCQSLSYLNHTPVTKRLARSLENNLEQLDLADFLETESIRDDSLTSEDENYSENGDLFDRGREYDNDVEVSEYDGDHLEYYEGDPTPEFEAEPDDYDYEAYPDLDEDEYSHRKDPDGDYYEEQVNDYQEAEPGHSSDEHEEYTEDKEEHNPQGLVQRDEHYRWHTVRVNKREKVLDLKLLEPYMKVITHGGFHCPERAVIVVIAACYLPSKAEKNYDFLMEQVFFYLISTLELLATTEEFYIVYFNGGTTQSNMPALTWMKRFYQHVEGGLKKNMINMFIVHPNLWLKTVVRFAKAFVSTNFWCKLQFVKSLRDLSELIPIEYIYIPDEVIRVDPRYRRVHNL